MDGLVELVKDDFTNGQTNVGATREELVFLHGVAFGMGYRGRFAGSMTSDD
jgi:hypothetical protein